MRRRLLKFKLGVSVVVIGCIAFLNTPLIAAFEVGTKVSAVTRAAVKPQSDVQSLKARLLEVERLHFPTARGNRVRAHLRRLVPE